MTKLDAGLMTSLPASDPGSTAVWGSKRINPRPQFCLCLTWSGYPSNDDDDDDDVTAEKKGCLQKYCIEKNIFVVLKMYTLDSLGNVGDVKPRAIASQLSLPDFL